MFENKTKQPVPLLLRLEYAKAFNKTPGRNDVSFAAPGPGKPLDGAVRRAASKIHIDPLIAATEELRRRAAQDDKPGEKKKDNAKKPADETVLLAFVGAAPAVRIDWTAKAEGASGLAALASVEAQQQVRIEEAVIRTHATLAYSISRAELTQLILEVPADQKVVNVSSPTCGSGPSKRPARRNHRRRAVPAGSAIGDDRNQLGTVHRACRSCHAEQMRRNDKIDDSARCSSVLALDVSRNRALS